MAKVPRWKRSDNIARVLSATRARGMLAALREVQAKNAPWVDDPDTRDHWWSAVLSDPRSQRTLEVTLDKDHPEAYLRLDRVAKRVIVVGFKCFDCRQGGNRTTEGLMKRHPPNSNVNALGEGIFDCPDPHARRNGRYCRFRFIEGGIDGFPLDLMSIRG